jgi:hypothetical protein
VPVGFLTDEQRQRYGRFHGEVNSEDISRYFHMDDSDRNLIALHRGNHNRLGFAVQLCTVRYLGAFPEDLTETPATVVSILGRQLDIEDTTCFGEYCSSRQRWDHTARSNVGNYAPSAAPLKRSRSFPDSLSEFSVPLLPECRERECRHFARRRSNP